MHKLNKNELKRVIGGLTAAEFAILAVFASVLIIEGFDTGNVQSWLNYFLNQVGTSNNIEKGTLAPTENSEGINIVGIKLVKQVMTNGDLVLLTEKNFRIISTGNTS